MDSSFRMEYRGGGEALMRYAVFSALTIANTIGCRLVTVDAYDGSVEFYVNFGFVRNKTQPSAVWVPETLSGRFRKLCPVCDVLLEPR